MELRPVLGAEKPPIQSEAKQVGQLCERTPGHIEEAAQFAGAEAGYSLGYVCWYRQSGAAHLSSKLEALRPRPLIGSIIHVQR